MAPDYVYYAIGRKLDEIHHGTAFSTVKHLSSKQIRNIEIPLCPLDEQRRIVDILNRAGGIRRMHREAHVKAEDLLASLMARVFDGEL